MIGTFKEIITRAQQEGNKKRIVVACPGEEHFRILGTAVEKDLVTPLFVGQGTTVEDRAKRLLPSSYDYEIVDEGEPDRALATAIHMMRAGTADILMQGNMAHQTFFDAIVDNDGGLRDAGRVSYASVYELLKSNKLIIVTDTYVNNFPSLSEKEQILNNAISLAGILEMESPKVAALASIEQVNPAIPSTLDAAILSKMSQRRQFGDVVVEGPLDIDCALDRSAAERKGVRSAVTGKVDIYIVPDIDVGYQLAQLMVFIGKMQTVGVLLGTIGPVIVSTPFVAEENKTAEIALAALLRGKGQKNG